MKPTRKTISILAGAAVVVGLAGFGVYYRLNAKDDAEDTPRDAIAAAAGGEDNSASVAIPVSGEPATRSALVMAVSAAGQAAAARQTVILAQVAGRVMAVNARENDAVAAGRPLVVIDPAEYELNLAEAQAEQRRAEATYRELTLFDDRIEDAAVRTQREAVARAKSGLDGAAVRVQRAELDLARTRLRAPFGGRVASVQVVPGQWVRAGDELMSVVALDPIKVEVQVLEAEIGALRAGAATRVSFAAFPDTVFTGRVQTINPLVDAETRTARVTVLVSNPAGRILPGMYARVSLDARQYADRVLVPRAAILERDRRTLLFVLEDGFAKWRYVTTGLENATHVEIVDNPDTEMVAPGEIILTAGHQTLVHDARVRLLKSDAEQR